MSPSEVLFKHSATDMIRWAEVFKRRWNERTKLDHQLARITQLLWYLQFAFGGKADGTKTMDDFFMSFEFKAKDDTGTLVGEDEVMEEAARRSYLAASKGAWAALLAPAAKAIAPRKKKPVPVPFAKTPAGKVLAELSRGPMVVVTSRADKSKPKKGA